MIEYILTYYFEKLKIFRGNVNKFFIDLLMASLTKKLSNKNANE